MGNWRTVKIVGTCDASELDALRAAIAYKKFEPYHCLSDTGGLLGVGNWAAINISAQGNLAERDYSVQDVASHLQQLVEVAPSLDIVVHCGGEYESLNVVNTIVVSNGVVVIEDPHIDSLKKTDEFPYERLAKLIDNQISRPRY